MLSGVEFQQCHTGCLHHRCENSGAAIMAGLLAELDQAKAENERLVRPRPDEDHPMQIRHGWLVEAGHEPNFVPGYGYEPDTDAAPLLKLSDLPGWPGADLDAALAAIQQVRAALDELVHHGDLTPSGRIALQRILGGES
ncbi:hypothetical protein SEA_TOGO_7 [Gordonia phage Togo]|nr:hypothetical protein SEA_TOGO_7 [Gordonia phage Togo]